VKPSISSLEIFSRIPIYLGSTDIQNSLTIKAVREKIDGFEIKIS